jgi:hypothetical protein
VPAREEACKSAGDAEQLKGQAKEVMLFRRMVGRCRNIQDAVGFMEVRTSCDTLNESP